MATLMIGAVVLLLALATGAESPFLLAGCWAVMAWLCRILKRMGWGSGER